MTSIRTLALGAVSVLALSAGAAQAEGEVNIYSYRQPELIQPLMDAFAKETGIKTNVLFLDKGLVERITAEGANSPADVILTVDIARLTEAKDGGVTQPLNDEGINSQIPAQYRDTDGNFIDVLAFRRKPEDVLSFPRSYWGSRSDRREALCKPFDYSESPLVATGVVGYTNYSSGQLAIKSITQERVMAVCVAVCSDLVAGRLVSRLSISSH